MVKGFVMAMFFRLRYARDATAGCSQKKKSKNIIPQQKKPWVMHYGPRVERTKVEQSVILRKLEANLKIFRREYGDFVGKDVRALSSLTAR